MSTLSIEHIERLLECNDELWSASYLGCERKEHPAGTLISLDPSLGLPATATESEWELVDFPMPRGLPRPLWHGMPIPYTAFVVLDGNESSEASKPNLRRASTARLEECQRERLCIHCGDELDDECVVAWDSKGSVVDGALHHRCARMVKAHCPRMKSMFAEGRLTHLVGPTALFADWHDKHKRNPDATYQMPLPHPQPPFFRPIT